MTQIPIISGIRAKETSDFLVSYPLNLEPNIIDTKISNGYLSFCPGVRTVGTGKGKDRGGINWNGTLYRVSGSYLIKVNDTGNISVLGGIGNDNRPAALDYGDSYLSISSNGNLYYWDPANGLRLVTDPDLGIVVDHIFVDGYNMTTDGTFLIVTELSDPMSVLPLKYGSSESDPDPITGLLLLRGEVYALNRYTIDVFQNVGGANFPFNVIQGATIPKGCVSRSAKCLFGENFAFVGSARNEALAVYQGGAGNTIKLSTREIDDYLAAVPDPKQIVLEQLVYGDEKRLLVHLPDKTLIFMPSASIRASAPVWYVRQSNETQDRPRFFVNVYHQWACGDFTSSSLGVMDETVTADFGQNRPWEFVSQPVYGSGIMHSVELIGLPGRVPLGKQSSVLFSYSQDGETWSEERAVSTGLRGQRNTRVQLRPHWRTMNYMMVRCRGYDSAHAGWARMEAVIEPMSV